MIGRTVGQIVTENLNDSVRASRGSSWPVSERSRITAQWREKLREHYSWIIAYNKMAEREEDAGAKRKEKQVTKRERDLLRLVGGGISAKELFARLEGPLKKTTIYDKIYDARKRPSFSTAETAAQSLALQGEARSQLLQLLGWYAADGEQPKADRLQLLDDAREQDGWMGECSLEQIGECLMLARGTMEKLRKKEALIDSYTAFRVLITLAGCGSVQQLGDAAYHCMGIHRLEDGETDRIAVICGGIYSCLYDCLWEQLRAERPVRDMDQMWQRDRIVKAHRVFWGMMYRLLKEQDYSSQKNHSGAFFAKQNMEDL